MEAMLTNWPARWRCISGRPAAMPCSTPRMFTSIMRFHSSTFSASSGESGITPALLMITSTRPKRCSAKSTKAWVSSRLVTSSARQAATPPRSPISATSFSSRRDAARPARRLRPGRQQAGRGFTDAAGAGDEYDFAGDVRHGVVLRRWIRATSVTPWFEYCDGGRCRRYGDPAGRLPDSGAAYQMPSCRRPPRPPAAGRAPRPCAGRRRRRCGTANPASGFPDGCR